MRGVPAAMQAPHRLRRTQKNLAEAQAHRAKLGYSAKPLPIKIQTRNLPTYRDPAVIVSDQLKKIYIVAELEHSGYAALVPPSCSARMHTIGLNVTGVSVDDPDGNMVENYSCNSERRLHPVLQRRGRQAAGGAVAANSTRKSAARWYGISSGSWSRTPRGRSSCMAPPAIAGSHVKNFKPHDNSQYNNLRLRGRVAG